MLKEQGNKIEFHGEIELPFADDRGSYDIWLLSAIEEAIIEGPEADDIYEKLKLRWNFPGETLSKT